MSESSRVVEASEADAQRGLLWLPLLQRLTALSPSALVWKNASSALRGHGDLDLIAPSSDWNAIEVEFRRWPEGGMLQQAAYKGLRFDKDPRDVVKEYRACIPEPKGSTRRGGAR